MNILACLTLLLALRWSTVESAEAIPAGYRRVAAEYGIPPTVLYAIALAESGKVAPDDSKHKPWPWTLNVNGEGRYFGSRQAAVAALTTAIANGTRSVDIGLMQVSWRYHRQALGAAERALDPYHNLKVGADILRTCFRSYRDWWAAVGCYHAPSNHARATQYRNRVHQLWRKLASAGD